MQDARGLKERLLRLAHQAAPKRSREDVNLTEMIRQIHSRSRKTCGYPGVHAELRLL